MTTININEAKTHLSRYAKRVKAGETIILADRNKPFAEIRPLSKKKCQEPRQLGQLSGLIDFGDDFFDADEGIEGDFLSGSLLPENSTDSSGS